MLNMEFFITPLLSKNIIILAYLFSYYVVLLAIFLFFFFFNIFNLKYLSELSFFSNYSFTSFFIGCAMLALTGLPPFFFFFVKLAMLSCLFITYPLYTFIFFLILIFLGWFIYLCGVKLFSTQSWSFSQHNSFGSRYTNTTHANFLSFFFTIFLFGGFLIFDFFLVMAWVLL